MSLLLTINSGPLGGKKIWINSGQTLQVGRTELADCTVENDKLMSRLHFAIDYEPEVCRIRDIGSRNGTFVNGALVKVAALADGDKILAGETEFQVTFKSADAPLAKGAGRKSWTKDRLNKKTNPATGVASAPAPSGVGEAAGSNQSPIILDDVQRAAMQTFVIGPPSDAERPSLDELTMAVPLKVLDSHSMVRSPVSKPVSTPPVSDAKGVRVIGSPQGFARPLDLARTFTRRPDFYLLINLQNMESEARSFFMSPIQGKRFTRVSDSLVLVSAQDDIDCFELFRRAWGRDAMIGLLSQSARDRIANTIRNFENSFMHPTTLRTDIGKSPPEGVKMIFSNIEAVLLENDNVDGWSILVREGSPLSLESLGLSAS